MSTKSNLNFYNKKQENINKVTKPVEDSYYATDVLFEICVYRKECKCLRVVDKSSRVTTTTATQSRLLPQSINNKSTNLDKLVIDKEFLNFYCVKQ